MKRPTLLLHNNSAHSKYHELNIHHDPRYKTVWYYMKHNHNFCFNRALLQNLLSFLDELSDREQDPYQGAQFSVVASDAPQVFNLGGDLGLFIQLIRSRQTEELYNYAKLCIDVIFKNYLISNENMTSIALIQGDALGGGFEAALATDVIIAEKGTKIGLPETLFNLFPGMGAFSFLSRKIGSAQAEKLILSGKLYTAEELHAMNVIDILADAGQGEITVYNYIKREQQYGNSIRALKKIKRHQNPVTYQELLDIVDVWVDAAMQLQKKDLRMMERLSKRQPRKISKAA